MILNMEILDAKMEKIRKKYALKKSEFGFLPEDYEMFTIDELKQIDAWGLIPSGIWSSEKMKREKGIKDN